MNHSIRFNLWPVSIISFFSAAILGCATFITFCSRHPADLISPNYYEEEVRYQGQIDRQKQTQAQAPLASVVYDQAARCISLSVPATMAAAKPAGQIQLYRPSAMNLDRTIKLDLTPSGFQSIAAGSLLPGLWKVRVSWSVGEHQYFIDQKVIVPTEAVR